MSRTENWLGSKLGRDTMARISPVCGSMATIAPVLPSSAFSAGALHVEINGEAEVLAGDGEFLAEMANLLAVGVDDNVAGAIGAAQERIVGLLNAGAAYDIAGGVGGVAGVVLEHLLGYFADVADEVGGRSRRGGRGGAAHHEFQAREARCGMRLDEGLFIGGDVLLERDALVLGGSLEAAESGLDLIDGKMKTLGDEGKIDCGVLDLLGEQIAGDGGVVVDEEAAFAIEDFCRGERGRAPCGRGWPPQGPSSCWHRVPADRHRPATRTARIRTIAYCTPASLAGASFSSLICGRT